tara:strand:- start:7435 stop:7584 length:150 start_codon:yes stop_codon:yes gene_type:complete
MTALTNTKDVTLNKVSTMIVIVTKESQIFLKKFCSENFAILDIERNIIL